MIELGLAAAWQRSHALKRMLSRALRWLVTSCSVALTMLSSGAAAQASSEEHVTLIWRTPHDAQCSSAEQLRAQVARLSDRRLSTDDPRSGYRIEVAVAQSEERWQADVKMRDARGQVLHARKIVGRTPSCGSVDVAAAVVIATMLDTLSAEPSEPVARTSPPPSTAGHHAGLVAFAAVSSELVPEAWLGGGFALELGDAIQLALSATAYAPGKQTDVRGRGAQLWGFHAGAALCPAAIRSAIMDLHVCAGAQGGAVFASGIGLTRATDTTVPLVLALAGPKLMLRLTRTFALQLAISAAWAFVRPKIVWSVADERQQAFTGTRIGLMAQLGVTISPW